ncbi:MAG: sulfotransferase [Rhodospirillales bacterium]|nr:sulfotransferase [Rhodospirillales bacterium]
MDLGDIGHFINDYRRLMDHWHRVLPVNILDISYETLVSDPEKQARRMTGYLGLDWDPACLEYHLVGNAVKTASKWQVREPVYSTSVDRWRRFESQLKPLIAILENVPTP